jgi:hypothetical protein
VLVVLVFSVFSFQCCSGGKGLKNLSGDAIWEAIRSAKQLFECINSSSA